MILRRYPSRKIALTTAEISPVQKGKIQKKRIKSTQINKKRKEKLSLTTAISESLPISRDERSASDTNKMDEDNRNSIKPDESDGEEIETREQVDSAASDATEITKDGNKKKKNNKNDKGRCFILFYSD